MHGETLLAIPRAAKSMLSIFFIVILMVVINVLLPSVHRGYAVQGHFLVLVLKADINFISEEPPDLVNRPLGPNQMLSHLLRLIVSL